MDDVSDAFQCVHCDSATAAKCGKGTHLLLHVVQGIRGVDRETDEDDVGVRIGERTKTVVIFLTSGIPKPEGDSLAVDHDIGGVVIEH